MHIVIIGATPYGISAAAHLRRQNDNIRITILEESTTINSVSCGFSLFLQGEFNDIDDISVASPSLLKKIFNIDVKTNIKISQIDYKSQTIYLENKQHLNYTKLIIAAAPIYSRPNIKGILGDNIFTLNTSSSLLKINGYFWGFNARNILIMGNSKQALQIAQAFAHNKAKVTILTQNHFNMDIEFFTLLQKKLQNQNITTITSSYIQEFCPNYAILNNNKKIHFDMTVIIDNSQPFSLPFSLEDISLGKNGHIIVDKNMQTNLKNIFACGEIIEIANSIDNTTFHPQDPSIISQTAKIAADNVMGINKYLSSAFNNEIIPIGDYYYGICGYTESQLKQANIEYNKAFLNTNLGENYIIENSLLKSKLLFDNQGRILSLQLWGQKGVFSRLNIVSTMMQQNLTINDLQNIYLSHLPQLSKASDTLNILANMASAITFGNLKTISLKKLQQTDLLLNFSNLNSNFTAYSFEVLNISIPQLRSQWKFLPRKRTIALFCQYGYSAYIAYCFLSSKGFKNIYLVNSAELWD